MRRLLKGIAVALALGFAMPAFAQSNRVKDTAKDVRDSAKNTAYQACTNEHQHQHSILLCNFFAICAYAR